VYNLSHVSLDITASVQLTFIGRASGVHVFGSQPLTTTGVLLLPVRPGMTRLMTQNNRQSRLVRPRHRLLPPCVRATNIDRNLATMDAANHSVCVYFVYLTKKYAYDVN